MFYRPRKHNIPRRLVASLRGAAAGQRRGALAAKAISSCSGSTTQTHLRERRAGNVGVAWRRDATDLGRAMTSGRRQESELCLPVTGDLNLAAS